MVNPKYLEIAQKIEEELLRRNFTTDKPEKAVSLQETIVNIITETLQGNTNYSYDSFQDIIYPMNNEDGWENDLQNQIS